MTRSGHRRRAGASSAGGGSRNSGTRGFGDLFLEPGHAGTADSHRPGPADPDGVGRVDTETVSRGSGEPAVDWHARALQAYVHAYEVLVAHQARLDPAELTDPERAGRVGDALCQAAQERAAAAFAEWSAAAAAVVAGLTRPGPPRS